MFTGIIDHIGTLKVVRRGQGFAQLEMTGAWDDLAIGESVAVNGACLTVVRTDKLAFAADVSGETLSRTILGRMKAGDRVNLERALQLGGRLGGHLVTGHVDTVGRIERITKRTKAWDARIAVDRPWLRHIADKGSVAVDGISLTVAGRDTRGFGLAIIPHSFARTTISHWRAGDHVNIETDLIAKYVETILCPKR